MRQAECARREVRKGWRGREADLDQALNTNTFGGAGEQQILRFDPANRRCELPGKQLNQQRPRGRRLIGHCAVPVVNQGLHGLGRNDVQDRLRKLACHFERTCNQVGNVSIFEDAPIQV